MGDCAFWNGASGSNPPIVVTWYLLDNTLEFLLTSDNEQLVVAH